MATDDISLLPPLTLVLGGQRSGKSAYGESLIGDRRRAVYLATGQAFDREMSERIAVHRKRRGENWTTVEEPLELAAALAGCRRPTLIDSLGMWVGNMLQAGRDVEEATLTLVAELENLEFPVVAVSEQAGLGVIPDNALARRFVDALGGLNQTIAARAGRVVLITAGLPTVIKG